MKQMISRNYRLGLSFLDKEQDSLRFLKTLPYFLMATMVGIWQAVSSQHTQGTLVQNPAYTTTGAPLGQFPPVLLEMQVPDTRGH